MTQQTQQESRLLDNLVKFLTSMCQPDVHTPSPALPLAILVETLMQPPSENLLIETSLPAGRESCNLSDSPPPE